MARRGCSPDNTNKHKPRRGSAGRTSSFERPFSQKLAIILGIVSIATLVIIGLVNNFYLTTYQPQDTALNQHEQSESDKVYNDLELAVEPFSGESKYPLDQIFGQSPIWGSLNSGHYFGLKLSSPNSIETSLIWFQNQINEQGRLSVRHLCDQNDQMKFYSWTRHDFHSFGEQQIDDNGYRIKTSYIKNPDNQFEWKALIDVKFMHNDPKVTPPRVISVIQYVTINHESDKLKLKSNPNSNLHQAYDGKPFSIGGYSKDVGEFQIDIGCDVPNETKNIILANYLSARVDKDRFPISLFLQTQLTTHKHNGTRLFILPGEKINRQQQQYHNQLDDEPNIIAYQLVLRGSASMTIDFKLTDSSTFDRFKTNHETLFQKKQSTFDEKFSKMFPVKYSGNDSSVDRLAKVALSNMIGSIGYFYGNSFINSDINPNRIVPYGPIQLLTGVPSRSFFPRGFLWDEAFHNLLISKWDPDLSNRIIKSWFNIMNARGWIPREVILGIEAMRRVPQEFIVQRITNANPPAMFIVIERMFDLKQLQDSTLESIYPKLKQWYNWFNATQFGPKSGTFRWRGRDEFSISMLNPKTLTSGLDDYPRPSHPSPLEYHVDLRCWMALAARTMAKLSKAMQDNEYHEAIDREAIKLSDNNLLEDLHWSEADQMFCDFGYDTEKAELKWVTRTRKIPGTNTEEKYRVLERHSESHPKFGCVKEFGYVSIFPVLLNILDPKSPKLGIILDRLRDEREVWSPYGIRSLSKSSKYYNKYNTEHDKPYWRGAVWLNINYLLLSSLESYSKADGPYKERCTELFIELKENLVSNVVDQFSITNYTWENYDDQTGQGKGSHPFTGWSSLILLIMSSNINL